MGISEKALFSHGSNAGNVHRSTVIHGRPQNVQRQGFREGNPLLGRHPRTFKVLSFTALLTGTQTTTGHMLREGFVESCRRTHAEAVANPDGKWAKREKYAVPKEPETCKYAMDVAPMMEWPYHTAVILGNINDLTQPKTTKGKP
jgi:hypothetical protein